MIPVPAFNPAKDGITHINVYSNGRTKLGQKLSHFDHAPWVTADGLFDCFEGWWFWQLVDSTGSQMALFGTPDREPLRIMTGLQAKEYGTAIVGKKKDWPADVTLGSFKAKYVSAAKAKLLQYPDLANLLKSSTLPLVHYYVIPVRQGSPITKSDPRGDWIMKVWEDFRFQLQNGQPL